MDVGSRDEAMTAPLVQTAKQGVEARDWSWVEGSVWTDRMLSALSNGVKGGVWYSLMDKVCAPATLRRQAEYRTVRGQRHTVRRRSGAWRSRKGGRPLGIPTVEFHDYGDTP